MKYFKKVKGERVYLSPVNPSDLEIYTKWLNDREISDRLGDGCLMINLETERKWIEDALKNGDHSYAIVLNEGDELLGNIGLFDVKQMYGTATVGLFIGEAERRGKGYGTEALKLLAGYAFDVLNLSNIMLCVYEFNENAYKSYIKVGFRVIGKRRKAYYVNNKYHDVIYMDITREDWYGNEN
jgi:RimJ/RimL family protein N-acetyltransferase